MKEGAPKSKIRTAFEKVATGAALLGVVAAGEVPTDAHAQPTHEQHETFNASREADTFLKDVASIRLVSDSSDGKRALWAIVDQNFDAFALSLEQQVPFSGSFEGSVTPTMRENARQLLLPKLGQQNTDGNPALERLQKILIPTTIAPATENSQIEMAPPQKASDSIQLESPKFNEDW
ncbi:MAG: hypothetical protein WC030_03270 [Candidatus Paceibacterota bacterium]